MDKLRLPLRPTLRQRYAREWFRAVDISHGYQQLPDRDATERNKLGRTQIAVRLDTIIHRAQRLVRVSANEL